MSKLFWKIHFYCSNKWKSTCWLRESPWKKDYFLAFIGEWKTDELRASTICVLENPEDLHSWEEYDRVCVCLSKVITNYLSEQKNKNPRQKDQIQTVFVREFVRFWSEKKMSLVKKSYKKRVISSRNSWNKWSLKTLPIKKKDEAENQIWDIHESACHQWKMKKEPWIWE